MTQPSALRHLAFRMTDQHTATEFQTKVGATRSSEYTATHHQLVLYMLLTKTASIRPCEPTYREPTYREPTYREPTYREPTYREPTYREPTYSEPTYRLPNYCEPTYCEPTYYLPIYWLPTYCEPINHLPIYCEPTYFLPIYCEPTYHLPFYCEPTYCLPIYCASIYHAYCSPLYHASTNFYCHIVGVLSSLQPSTLSSSTAIMTMFKFCCRCLELLGTMCTNLFGATAPVVVPNRVGQLLLIMSKAAARKIDFLFFCLHIFGGIQSTHTPRASCIAS
jgi:hypothetical protein